MNNKYLSTYLMVTLAVAAMLVMAPTATLAQKGNPHFVGQQPQITLSGVICIS